MDRDKHAGYWMQTYTGIPWFFDDPRAEDVRIEDVAHALSNLCRYGGHSRYFYSVAEHSVLVSRLVSPEHALCGLLHDATEAYIVDVPRPLKRRLADYKLIEDLHWVAIASKFGLPASMPDEVDDVDGEMLFIERDQLLPGFDDPQFMAEWGMGRRRSGKYGSPTLSFLRPAQAERLFLQRFEELKR